MVSSGYDVMPAATGEQALTLANTWTPQVIVLDLGLADIDGWEVARRLKAAPQTTAIGRRLRTRRWHSQSRTTCG
jgi:two-component system cell cycle response regulator DivK